MSRRVRATIHLGALKSNLARIRALAPRSRVMAVVKADGYGHGLERTVRALSDADAFGVASIADGERIRALGMPNRIVVLSGIDEAGDLARMRALALEPVIHHDSQLELLQREWPATHGNGEPAARTSATVSGTALPAVWIKLDTGMHRLGFDSCRAAEVLETLRGLPGIGELQLMTHFANSDVASDPLTNIQMQRFEAVCTQTNTGREPSSLLPCSLANSAAIVGFPASHGDWVRAGGLLYGISVIDGGCGVELGFEPAMTLTARLIAVNEVGVGERVGYGHAWTATRATRVGVLAVGYADGYPRSIRADTPVLVRGVRVPIIGRVSMDLTTIDLTDLPDVQASEEAVLWGRGLPVEEIGAAAATIGYELVCGMTRRVDFVEDHS